MSDVEVLYEGVLSLCRSPSKSSRDWTQRLFVLKLHRDTNTTMLDYYKDKKKRWQKQDTVGVIPLFPSFKLSLAHECGYKFPLKLVASGQIYYLSATDFRSMNAWFHHIQLSQVLGKPKKGCYEYEVLVKPSESTGLVEARGTCLLALTANNEIVCASFPRRQILGVWPYDSLRGYWCKEQAFGFEAGRRSPRGEGIFEFITDKKENIYRHLETAIMRLKQGDTRPPLPSPDSDTPPVSTSSSDTEATPPPLPPPPTKLLQKAGSVRTLPPSAAAPASLRRVNTHTGVKKWLNDTYNPDSPSNTRRSLSPLSGDDTYSRTVHPFPQPRHTTTPDPPGLTYQRLHGHDGSRHSLNLNSQGVHNLAEEDMRTYDVAFPDATARPLPLLPDNEYSVLGTPDPSRVALPINNPPQRVAPPINNNPQRGAPPINNPPQVATTTVTLVPMPTVQNDTQLDDADMTDNPMYDSQDDILKAIEKMSGAQVTPPLQHRVLVEPPLSQLAVGGMSPAYEAHTLDRDTTPKAEQNNPLEHTEVVATEDPSQESKPVKPYSKVKKKPSPSPLPESGTEERGSDGGSPPPLPARLYSMDSSNSDPPNNDS